jgi:hypothetical protein
MRLSGWRKTAPAPESMSAEVLAVLNPVLADLGAEADPDCWVVWGDDPQLRYAVLVPTLAGLITAVVRTAGPEGGPRTSARLIRWSKLSVSELALESSGGHRIVAVQVETHVLKGTDDEADRICEFMRGLIAEIDDRHPAPVPIAYIQEAAARTAVAPPPAVEARAPSAAAAGSKEAVKRSAAEPKPSPVAKPAVRPGAVPEAVPAAGVKAKRAPATASPAAKAPPAAASATLALGSGPAPAEAAAPGASGATATPPKPAEEQAGASPHAGSGGAGTASPRREEAPEEVDRSKWIPPHSIVEATPRKPHRPRPWRP